MATPGVGVLIDTDRLKDKEKQATPYFIEVDGTRYYGKSPESAVKAAKKAFKSESSTNIVPYKVKKQKQTAVIGNKARVLSELKDAPVSVTSFLAEDLKLLGLPANPTVSEIQSAYRGLIRTSHPNKGGNPDVFREQTAAKERLVSAAAEKSTSKGGGKMRKSLRRKRTFRKHTSTTRKHLK